MGFLNAVLYRLGAPVIDDSQAQMSWRIERAIEDGKRLLRGRSCSPRVDDSVLKWYKLRILADRNKAALEEIFSGYFLYIYDRWDVYTAHGSGVDFERKKWLEEHWSDGGDRFSVKLFQCFIDRSSFDCLLMPRHVDDDENYKDALKYYAGTRDSRWDELCRMLIAKDWHTFRQIADRFLVKSPYTEFHVAANFEYIKYLISQRYEVGEVISGGFCDAKRMFEMGLRAYVCNLIKTKHLQTKEGQLLASLLTYFYFQGSMGVRSNRMQAFLEFDEGLSERYADCELFSKTFFEIKKILEEVEFNLGWGEYCEIFCYYDPDVYDELKEYFNGGYSLWRCVWFEERGKEPPLIPL